MAAERTISRQMPKVVREGGVLRLVVNGDPGYDSAANHLDPGPDDRLEPR